MAKKVKGPLRGRPLRVVLNVIEGMDHAQAALKAGYRGKRAVAGVTTAEILRDPRAQALIAKHAERASDKTGITKERVLKELETLAMSDISHYYVDDFGKLALADGAPPDAMRAVSSIKYRTITTGTGDNTRTTREVEFRLWDKPGMVRLAGRHVDVKGFFDRMELTGKNGEAIKAEVHMYIPDNGRAAS